MREGAVVGASVLVPEDFEIPPKTMALGVPVRLRETEGAPSRVEYAVRTYLAGACYEAPDEGRPCWTRRSAPSVTRTADG